MSFIQEVLIGLVQKIDTFESLTSKRNKELKETLSKISEFTKKIEKSWSRSWFIPQASFYFYKFNKAPANAILNLNAINFYGMPEDWMELDFLDIKNIIDEYFEFDLSQTQKEISEIIREAEGLRDLLCVELSIIKLIPKFDDEIIDLENIKNIEWAFPISDFIKLKRTESVLVGRLDEIQRLLEVPPHIEYEANIFYLQSAIFAINDFVTKSKNLIRKLQIKEEFPHNQPVNDINNVIKICNKFHDVALQLRKRRKNKQTFKIADEYDVQDLFHALLRIFFEDIRSEEWTPSYAGSSSRVDFLLKGEKIVIEIKKTRESLSAKDIGDQLLIDIGRYKSHPDCQNLICFVYDPEGRINNPKGIEEDLNQLSNKKINVIALIRPYS